MEKLPPISQRPLVEEAEIRSTRSGGPGGQHVNKTETAVQLQFDIAGSFWLSDAEKQRALHALPKHQRASGVLMIRVEETRSQHRNKQIAINRMFQWLESHTKPVAKRKKTQVPGAIKRKRLEEKKRQSEKKANRSRLDW